MVDPFEAVNEALRNTGDLVNENDDTTRFRLTVRFVAAALSSGRDPGFIQIQDYVDIANAVIKEVKP